MSAYRVDLDGLGTLVARMDAFEQRAADLAADADRAARRLGVEWTGAAADAHAAAHGAWLDGEQRMRSALRGLRAALAGAEANYGAAVSANARMWG